LTENNNERPPGKHLVSTIEAILFASGDPVSVESLSESLGGIETGEIETSLDELADRYSGGSGGLQIEKVAGGFRIATRSEIGGWVRQYFRSQNKTRLTPATLEVLAIVAYRQPVTSPEIQAIRQKDATYGLKVLLEKRLIRIMGRKKVLGNPLLYGTSKHFLVHFGLDSLKDLPSIEEFESFVEILNDGQDSLLEEPEAMAATTTTANGAEESEEPAR
jgi:segregation and condensation protein B